MTLTAVGAIEPDDWDSFVKAHEFNVYGIGDAVTITYDDRDYDVLDDGFGNIYRTCGSDCDLAIVRPGLAQCGGKHCEHLGEYEAPLDWDQAKPNWNDY